MEGGLLSVRPVLDESGEGDDSGSEVDADLEGTTGERLRLSQDEEVVKKLRDLNCRRRTRWIDTI